MKYLVRKELDFDHPVNLRRLKPFMKIYAGAICKWRESERYKNGLNKRLEQEYAKRVKQDEKLKEVLLALIFKELDNNHSMEKKGEECAEIVLCVKSKFIYSLNRILDHKDFLPYVITKVEEEEDLRVAFPEMPILLRVSKRTL